MGLKIIFSIWIGFGLINQSIAAPVHGDLKTAVILVNFTDTPTQPISVSGANNLVFTTVNGFFKEGSYQKLSLSGETFGWFTIPVLSSECNRDNIAYEGSKAATAMGANMASYTHVVYMFPRNSGCGWSGTTGTGPNGQREVFVNNNFTLYTIAHEFGHVFGLNHSGSLDCDTGSLGDICVTNEYGDVADTMGNRNVHFNAFQKEQIGWLNSAGVPSITTVSSSGRYNIAPMAAFDQNAKALKILKSVDPITGYSTWYYVEYRLPIGYDSALATVGNLGKGLLVRLGKLEAANWPTSLLLDMTPNSDISSSISDFKDVALEVGKTYSDSGAGVTITLVALDANGAAVDVKIGSSSNLPPPPPPSGDSIAPVVSILSPANGALVPGSSVVTISASASDNIGVSKVEFYVNGSLKCTDTSASYSCSWAVPKGNAKIYIIEAKAIDAAGNIGTSQISVSTGSTKGRR